MKHFPCLQVDRVNKFTQLLVEKLRMELQRLQAKTANADKENQATKEVLLKVRALLLACLPLSMASVWASSEMLSVLGTRTLPPRVAGGAAAHGTLPAQAA